MLTEILSEANTSACPARLLGVFENGSPEWHQARATGVGGSDVGTIIGVNKYESPLSLWAKKLGLIDAEVPESEPMYWGTTLEPVVLAEFQKRHPELKVYPSPGTFYHVDRPWQLANPDGVALNPETGEWFVIEIKTARYEDEWDEKQNIIPPSYRAQVLWYLQTFGYQRAYVATLFSGSKYREFEVEADAFEQDANLRQVELWRTYLADGTQPDYDGSEATYEAVREMHPEIDPDLPDVELHDIGSLYLIATKDFEQAEAHLREMKARVMDLMGKAKRGLVAGEWIVTRQAKAAGRPYLVNKKG